MAIIGASIMVPAFFFPQIFGPYAYTFIALGYLGGRLAGYGIAGDRSERQSEESPTIPN